MSHGLFHWELPSHPKWAPLSDGAFRLGISAILWARHPERVARRPGFVPSWMMTVLSRKSEVQTAKFVRELVDAGQGLHEAGILEPVEGGWMVHDFPQYGSEAELAAPAGTSSAKAEAGRLGGLRSAETRRLANGTAQPSKQNPEARRSNIEANLEAAAEAGSKQAPKQAPKHGVSDLSGSPSDLPSDPEQTQSGDPPKPPTEATEAELEAAAAEADEKAAQRAEAREHERAMVREVFEYWQQETGHERAFLDRKRGNRILARLRENKTVEDLKLAIRNRRNDPHLMGETDAGGGKVYDGIETLLRDAGQVERLMALTEPLRLRRIGPAVVGQNVNRLRERAERIEAEERRAAQEAGSAAK